MASTKEKTNSTEFRKTNLGNLNLKCVIALLQRQDTILFRTQVCPHAVHLILQLLVVLLQAVDELLKPTVGPPQALCLVLQAGAL